MVNLDIVWYGRCCFLITIGDTKILTDPHDSFDNVEIGTIETNYTLISSVAHDHGHIGAAPKSKWNYGEEGEFETKEGIKITGIKSREERGTKNIIFNIRLDKFSITNFADWGREDDINNFSKRELEILRTTNIALARPNLVKEGPEQMAELALKVCHPNIIIPHHSYPESFVKQNTAENMRKGLAHYSSLITRLTKKLENKYKTKKVDSYKMIIHEKELKENSTLLFQKIHPQVKYINIK